jgi:heptaprenyl diphosphate synthase
MALMAVFLAYALVMGIIENRIPFDFFVPGVKLGLANVVILASIYLFPARDALKILLMKCLLTAIATGTGFSLLYSLSGGLLSFLAMVTLAGLPGNPLSPIGVSVIGAVAHNFGQILVASAVVGALSVMAYLPVLIVSGVVTGILVGVAAKGLLHLARRHARHVWKKPRKIL